MHDQRGRSFTLVGLRLPVGVAIHAPVAPVNTVGIAKLPELSPFKGNLMTMNDKQNNAVNYTIRGDLTFAAQAPGLAPGVGACNLSAGSVIANVADTGALTFSTFNLTIDVERPDPAGQTFVSDEDLLRQLFPAAYAKPAFEVNVDTSAAGTTVTTYQCK